ncbi:hypothetical protein MRB53_011394 [Persea americana]|uniref:Uncharacterized protein n=1 Tax=Persea americana TaxID=3435 RepID=A0ACC2LW46_PERAE|nr:hypothetical protein MRB53_011394 [Persea americana]
MDPSKVEDVEAEAPTAEEEEEGLDQQWSWEDDGHKQAVLAYLEWGTDEEAGVEGESNEEEFVVDEEFGEIEGASDQNGGDTSHGENSPRVGRARGPPVWMRDYEFGQGLSDEEIANTTHLALFTDGDPRHI